MEDILEFQKQFEDITNERFMVRLISLYGKAGMFDNARKVFDEMPELKCVEINDLGGQCVCRVDVKPSLFYKRKWSKCLQVNSAKIDIYWDISLAKYGSGSQLIEG
ncbi:hypothetical protein POM88_006363 [Heracleum sosnowskyi]|uniref:Pentatricopeptide repeat-containing protein n=1 Tax=Heracleum sosnowskyi TaxID=360622 RepID=A0AAD8J2G3_9APIA|nr:hypothetical protein POM88_006363 [Heracleum sosnowskyi]